jgi:hypothetical protein
MGYSARQLNSANLKQTAYELTFLSFRYFSVKVGYCFRPEEDYA